MTEQVMGEAPADALVGGPADALVGGPADALVGGPADPAEDAPRRRGRRPSGEDTRGAILAAARGEFGSRGYDGTTIRGIARAAGVDARLVHHYFDGKEEIFVEAMGFPVRPLEIIEQVLAGPRDGLGERLARTFVAIYEQPGVRERMVGLLSGALAGETGARMLREFITRELLSRIAAQLDADRPQERAALAASQLVGVVVVRVIVRIEPLASLDSEELVAALAPVLQYHLTAERPGPERRPPAF
jgi:AcrR family transcriptional regulator